MPYSKFKHSLGQILSKDGWVGSIEVKEEAGLKTLIIKLKYDGQGQPAISGIKRVSKPGQRIYTGKGEIPYVRSGMGATIISTSRGLMNDRVARKEKVGGEVICQIW